MSVLPVGGQGVGSCPQPSPANILQATALCFILATSPQGPGRPRLTARASCSQCLRSSLLVLGFRLGASHPCCGELPARSTWFVLMPGGCGFPRVFTFPTATNSRSELMRSVVPCGPSLRAWWQGSLAAQGLLRSSPRLGSQLELQSDPRRAVSQVRGVSL